MGFLLLLTAVCYGEDHAPLPAQVANAKTVFLVNGGGSDTAYDAFYAAMKQWGHYQIVGYRDKADLIITIEYRTDYDGSSLLPIYNGYTKQTTYYTQQIIDPQIIMVVTDARTGDELWSAVEHQKLVRLRRHVANEIGKAADRLVEDLKSRMQ